MNLRIFSGIMASLLFAITPGNANMNPQSPPWAAEGPAIKQRGAASRITIPELMALFDQEFGQAPLTEENLRKNKRFILVNTKVPTPSKTGIIPGSINIPTSRFATDIPKLPRDRMIIFYCGGVSCPLAAVAAGIAKENGLTDVHVWHECGNAWGKAGNYRIAATEFVKRLVDDIDQEVFMLIDSRPHRLHRNEFIPGAVSIPWERFEQKKGLLPADKSLPLVFYCSGHNSSLSHYSARAAIKLGYTNVYVYTDGVPEWKKQGMHTIRKELQGFSTMKCPGFLRDLPGEKDSGAVEFGRPDVRMS